MVKVIVFLTVLVAILFGCESDAERELSLEAVEITQLVKSSENRITDSPKRFSVVRSPGQFETEWSRISSEQVPVVDFSNSFVVIAEMGYQGSGRGNIEITAVLNSVQHSEVRVTTLVRGRNCQVTAAVNSPYHVVVFPRPAIVQDVIINEEYKVVDCER